MTATRAPSRHSPSPVRHVVLLRKRNASLALANPRTEPHPDRRGMASDCPLYAYRLTFRLRQGVKKEQSSREGQQSISQPTLTHDCSAEQWYFACQWVSGQNCTRAKMRFDEPEPLRGGRIATSSEARSRNDFQLLHD